MCGVGGGGVGWGGDDQQQQKVLIKRPDRNEMNAMR